MGTSDIYQAVSDLAPESAQTVIDRLEFRGTDPGFVAMREAYLERLDLGSAGRILDLGCGTGVVARALAGRADIQAEIVGEDMSDVLIAAAKGFAEKEGLGERITFRVGDSHRLGAEPAAVFDIIIAHTLISHVAEPATVIRAAAGTLAPGGLLALFDGDYASLTFGAGDKSANARMARAIIETVVANPHVMRDMPGLIAGAGLDLVDFLPHVHAEAGGASFFDGMLDSYMPMAVSAGAAPADQCTEWVAGQKSAIADGTFFAACNFYTYIVRKPG